MILPFPQTPLVVREALVLEGAFTPGRPPVPSDAVYERLAKGTLGTPREGDTLEFDGKPHAWRRVAGDKDGWIPAEDAYVLATVELPAAATMILDARGDAMVCVNGVPRAGDPYATGGVHLPVELRAGTNTLLFLSTRGRIRASLAPPARALAIDLSDTTLPDALTTDRSDLLGGLLVTNAGPARKGLRMRVTLPDGRSRDTILPGIPSLSFRKLPVALPLPYEIAGTSLPLRLELREGSTVLDSAAVTLRVRKPNEIHRRTFVSDVDGSVQYYAVVPAQKPGPDNVLALTLHGASVEAQGQAEAYRPKDDVTLVAPTNRRPFGFDWEEVGRIDALEVLGLAARTVPHDPRRVVLTGHSMGGHGTWSVGTLYPDRFAALAPSAGWISWWSYVGSWTPDPRRPADAMVARAAVVLDPLPRLSNALVQGVYILHGDADDNVPPKEARTMRAELERLRHPDLGYHEEPGAGHWWDGAVDYPDLFAMLRKRRLDPNPTTVDFITPAPGVSARAGWATVEQVTEPGLSARIRLTRNDASVVGTTENVAALTLKRPLRTLTLDGQAVTLAAKAADISLIRRDGRWREGTIRGKTPAQSGPFKAILGHKVVFVMPTGGTPEENALAGEQARFDAETFLARGNGAVDLVTDAELLKGGFERRNVLLYGNADTNRAWDKLLRGCPIVVRRGRIEAGGKTVTGTDLGVLLVRPRAGTPDALVGAIAPTGAEGARRLVRTGLLVPGVTYPDWTVVGAGGIVGAGYFANDWSLGPTAWNPRP